MKLLNLIWKFSATVLLTACLGMKADAQAMAQAKIAADVPSIVVAWLYAIDEEDWVLVSANVFLVGTNSNSTSISVGRSLSVVATAGNLSSIIKLAVKAKSGDGRMTIDTSVELNQSELSGGRIIARGNVGSARNLIVVCLAAVRESGEIDPFK